MSIFLRVRSSHVVGLFVALASLAVVLETAQGQAGGIGARGGQTGPMVPVTSLPSTLPTTPVLPSNLKLPPEATSSLLKGLDQSGTALRPGMGWLVSDMTH